MNITDIDDKIIKRARQKYLYANYITEEKELSQTLTETKAAMDLLLQKAKVKIFVTK